MGASSILYLALMLASYASCDGYQSAMDNILSVNTKVQQEASAAGYSAPDQTLIFEGDIEFNHQTALQLQYEYKKAMGTDTAYDAANNWGFWYKATVPYVIDNSLRNVPRAMQAIRNAIAVYNKHTCIRLVPRNGQRDYVWMNLNPKKGCSSWIGRQGGGQELSLNWGCHSTGTTVHEIMHAIGFYHEQSRMDRDTYVNIYWNNIPWDQKFNFHMYRRGQATTYGFPYDKKSIMHYGRFSFPLNRNWPTITAISNYYEHLGGEQLTSIDINQINHHYSCKRSYSIGMGPFPSSECKDRLAPAICALPSFCSPVTKLLCKKTCKVC